MFTIGTLPVPHHHPRGGVWRSNPGTSKPAPIEGAAMSDDDFHPTRACSACIGLAASILIVAGWAFGEWDSPNGELGLWYSVATCFDDSASFGVGGIY